MLKITKNQGSIQVTADKSGFYPFDGTITFPTNSLFTATSANTDMITFKSTSNGDVQFVGNYKDITISGRSYDTKQKFLTAFSNLANQGSVDAYTKAETDAKIDAKQDKLKAGNGITLTEDATDGTTVVKTAVSLTDNGNGHYAVGDSIKMGDGIAIGEYAYSYGSRGVAVGSDARAAGEGVVAIGHYSVATNDNPLVIRAGYKIIGNSKKNLTVLQSDSNGKLSILKGDGTIERMVIQDEIEALKNAGGGTVDAYTKAETDTKLDAKQDKLTAGSGITITKDETAGTNTIATAVSLTDNGNGAYTVGDSIKMDDCIAIGRNTATAYSNRSVIIGNSANSNGSISCVTIGTEAQCKDGWSIAIGTEAKALYRSNIAIGGSAQADVTGSIAIGTKAKALYLYSTAIGYMAASNARYGLSIGYGAETNDTTPLVINAGYKTVDGNDQPLTVLQSDSNGKLSILKGDGTDERIVIQDALSAGGSGGTVDAYTKAETDAKLDAKQGKLKAGNGITLTEDATDGTTVVKTKLSMGRGPYDDDGIKIGRIARLASSGGIALGDESLSEHSGIAIGHKAQSNGQSTIVIGNNSSDYGSSVCSGVVIGTGARGGGAGVVIGTGARGGSAGAVIGYNSTVDGNGYGYAIGDNVHISETTNMVPIAIGYGAVADETKPLAITILKVSDTDSDGTPEMKYCDFIQGDANGKISLLKGNGTDERMVIQDEIAALKNAGGGSANPLVNVKGTGNATITDTVTDAVAIGGGAKVTEELSVAIGAANALSGHCVAIGGGANATKMSSVAIGDGACATAHMFDVAIGFHAATTDTKPLEINAGYKTVGGATTPLTVLQSDKTGKLSILKGDDSDERIVISDEITALKAEITTLKAEIAALKGGASTGA